MACSAYEMPVASTSTSTSPRAGTGMARCRRRRPSGSTTPGRTTSFIMFVMFVSVHSQTSGVNDVCTGCERAASVFGCHAEQATTWPRRRERNMNNSKVLISGASIGGPALAYWLHRYGFEVTVVEKAESVRPGGQAVDFKGATHHTVLTRMGILDDVRALSLPGEDGAVVDAAGRTLAVVPHEFSGGEI